MKIIILIILLCSGLTSFAQSGFDYLDLMGGAMVRNNKVGELSYEWVGKYYKANEIFLEYVINKNEEFNIQADSVIISEQVNRKNILVGYAYKPLLTRSKNIALSLRLAGGIGGNNDGFIASLSISPELNITFGNGWIWSIREKNQVVFYDPGTWRIGILTGLKIPLKN